MNIPNNVKLGGWAIDKQEWESINRLFREYTINSVVEFGGGSSSFCFSQFVTKHMIYEKHEPTILSLDKINALIIRRDTKIALTDEQIKQDLELIGLKKFDLAFVDGPPAFRDSMLFNGCARYFSVQAAIKMSDMILIHDTKRKGEQNTIDKLLYTWSRIELRSKRGLTLFIKDETKIRVKATIKGKRTRRNRIKPIIKDEVISYV